MTLPDGVGIVAGSANARVGLQAAVDSLRNGGSAIDAAIEAVKLVEDNLDDRGVGTGGMPNVIGQVELDATIMDGRNLAAGSVGAVKNYPHPIEIARKVMELTPHVMLVGEGAELFAKHNGFDTAELLTEDAEKSWRERIDGASSNGNNVYEDSYQLYMQTVDERHRPRRGRKHCLCRFDEWLGIQRAGTSRRFANNRSWQLCRQSLRVGCMHRTRRDGDTMCNRDERRHVHETWQVA